MANTHRIFKSIFTFHLSNIGDHIGKFINTYKIVYYPVHVILWTLAIILIVLLYFGLCFMANHISKRSEAFTPKTGILGIIINKENYEMFSRIILSLSIVTFIFKTTLTILNAINSLITLCWVLISIYLIYKCFNKSGIKVLNKYKFKYRNTFDKFKDRKEYKLSYSKCFLNFLFTIIFKIFFVTVIKLKKYSKMIFLSLMIIVIVAFFVNFDEMI